MRFSNPMDYVQIYEVVADNGSRFEMYIHLDSEANTIGTLMFLDGRSLGNPKKGSYMAEIMWNYMTFNRIFLAMRGMGIQGWIRNFGKEATKATRPVYMEFMKDVFRNGGPDF